MQDLRYALRQLRKSPGFTLTAVITLALGIGANTAIFTLVQGILLQRLPVADPSRLFRIGDTDNCCVNGGFVSDAGDFDIFSYDLFLQLKRSAPEFEQLSAVQAGSPQWSVRRGNTLSKELHGEFVTGNFFSMFGIGPAMGRVFTESDDTPSSSPVLVLSYRTWQSEFAGDPWIVGSTVSIQTKPFTVIGIAPAGFFGDRVTDVPADFWMPINMEPYTRGSSSILTHQDSNWLYAIGRVRPNTNIGALQSRLSQSLRNWLSTRPVYTDNGGSTVIPKQHVVIVPAGGGIQNLQQENGLGLKMLMVLSSFVLLIACANIANLLLARGTARRADIAVRMAMGAGRSRVIRQIITESVLLSCIGGLVGLAVAYSSTRVILGAAFPDARNMPINASPSLLVLGFAFLVSLITGILFGLAPAWLSSHAQPAEVLRGSNRSVRDRASFPQMALVIIQAAMSLVLIAGAILLTRSLTNLEHQDFGIATTNRYVLHFDPAGAGYTTERAPGLYRQLEERFAALPGVTSIGMALYSPLEGDNWGECVIQQGHPAPGPNDHCGSTWDRVSPGFLSSMGVPIVHGRDLSINDTANSPMVAVVNQTFVKRFFPKDDPLGKHFGIDFPQYSGSFEIVGVFRDFKINNPRELVRPVFLRPLAQPYTGYKEAPLISTETQSMLVNSMVVNFRNSQQNAEELTRRTIADIDPNLTIMNMRSMNEQVAGNFNQDRLIAQLTGLFGILALIIASVGLYGVMSYFVARRTGEIGIRMALGATRSSVISMVFRSAFFQVVFGFALGIPFALLAGHFMASQLYGVGAYDPASLTEATLVLALCAAIAVFVPARRASTIEPMRALRIE
ncbi:MAG: ABC transporter permease [Acidobacteria bacterium]|nr:ABC transporter permease [Acidobacteriota bacterium]